MRISITNLHPALVVLCVSVSVYLLAQAYKLVK